MLDKKGATAFGLALVVVASACGGVSDAADATVPSGASPGVGTGGTGDGGDSPEGSDAGDGGDSEADDAGAGLLPRPVESLTEACIEYGLAQLQRKYTCEGHLSDFDPAAAVAIALGSCPDLFVSDGSTRTVQSLIRCAEGFAQFPCEELLRGLLPECATPGTRTEGEVCSFPSQCQSGACSGAPSTCGECLPRLAPGQACADADGRCERGYYCDGVCMEVPAGGLQPAPSQPPTGGTAAPGEPCTASADCADAGLCFADEEGVHRCTARVPVGGSCSLPTAYCTDDAYCDPDYRCVVLPGLGEPCGVVRGEASACATELSCDRDDPAMPTCVPSRRPCEDGGSVCPGGSICCDTCEPPVCQRIVLPGEACNTPTVRCHRGSECRAGVCEALDSQGLFEAACGL